MSVKNLLQAATLVAATSIFTGCVSLGGLMGGSSGGDFGATEGEVVGLINTSLQNLTKSQAIMLDALDLKDEAAVAENTAKSLEDGSLTGKDELAEQIENAKSTNEKIKAEMSKNVALSEDAKRKFGTALLPYGKGVVAGISGAKKAADALKSLSSDPMNITKFGTLVYVGKEAPGLLSMFADATSSIKDFATYQGINTDDLSAADESGL